MAAPTVTPPPPAPARNVADPETYIGVADAWAADLPRFGAEVQAAGEYANTKAVAAATSASAAATSATAAASSATTANTKAGEAAASATAATGSATAAANSATAAANAAAGAAFTATSTTSNAIATGSKTWAVGAGYSYQSGQFALVSDSADAANWLHGQVTGYSGGNLTINVTRVNGSGTKTSWNVGPSSPEGPAGQGVPTGGTTGQVLKKSSGTDYDAAWADQDVTQILRSARTSNTQLAASDKGKSIEYTTGGFTQTLAACSSLGAGWFVYVVNSSTGDVTFDPNGSETIGGVNAATTAVLKPGQSAILITDGTNLYFAGVPTSFRNMEIFTSGGTFTPKPGVSRYYIKAVGGGGGGSYGGGAAGGYAEGWADITSSQTITIGSGGGPGSSGGTTSVGSIVTCNGGSGGTTSSGGGPSSGGTATFSGGLTLRGSDGGGNITATYGGTGGASPFGGAGAAANGSYSGTSAGSNTGSGGGGNPNGSGGSGGSGLVLIMW